MNIKKVKKRITWEFNPVSRIVPSKKLYNRKKLKKYRNNTLLHEL